MRNTWKITYDDGSTECVWCEKKEIPDNLNARKFAHAVRAEMLNKATDHVRHRPLNRGDLLKLI